MHNKLWMTALAGILTSIWAGNALADDSLLLPQPLHTTNASSWVKVSQPINKVSPFEQMSNKLEQSRRVRESKRLQREQEKRDKAQQTQEEANKQKQDTASAPAQ